MVTLLFASSCCSMVATSDLRAAVASSALHAGTQVGHATATCYNQPCHILRLQAGTHLRYIKASRTTAVMACYSQPYVAGHATASHTTTSAVRGHATARTASASGGTHAGRIAGAMLQPSLISQWGHTCRKDSRGHATASSHQPVGAHMQVGEQGPCYSHLSSDRGGTHAGRREGQRCTHDMM